MQKVKKKEAYVIEREFLGLMTVRELIGTIIRSHAGSHECNPSNCITIKTVENALDI